MLTSHAISNGKYLIVQRADAPSEALSAPAPQQVDHVICIDVSGSMSGELPLVRSHLKQKLVKLVAPGDTLSIIWFSGRGQHGTLLTEHSLKGLLDVKEAHDAIDRFLHPIGMTGFKEPLEDCKKVWTELRKKRPDALSSLLFMSDGCDNQWPKDEIFGALEQIYGKFQASTFVEYGYYADRKMLSAMAERMGGTVVCAEDFPGFQPVVERAITGGAPSRSFCKLETPGCKDFAFSVMPNGDLNVYGIQKWGVTIACDPNTEGPTSDVVWLSDIPFGTPGRPVTEVDERDPSLVSAVYAAVSAYAYRMRGDLVKPLLLDLRDPGLLQRFSTCFGKQRYSQFSDDARLLCNGPMVRVSAEEAKGFFRTDLPTMLDLFELLSAAGATAMIEHAMFKYDRITRKTVDVDPNGPRFKPDGAEGFPISGLVYNENRCNLSMRLKKWGMLDLSNVPGRPARVPEQVRAYQWRNYALVADGVVHIDLLPVRVDYADYQSMSEGALYKLFDAMGVIKGVSDAGDAMTLMLDLRLVGLTNEATVAQPSGRELLELEVRLLDARVRQKVFNHYEATCGVDDVVEDSALLGLLTPQEVSWLGGLGYKGALYQPKKKVADAVDVYKAVELKTSIKSFSSLPKIDEVISRIKSGQKMTPSMEIMSPHVKDLEQKRVDMAPQHFRKLVEGLASATTAETRHLIYRVAKRKFAILLGQTWFKEACDPGTLSLPISFGGRMFDCTIELRDIDVEV